MTPQQIAAIKQSWQQISKLDTTAVGQSFYAYLFETSPDVQPLFKSPQPEQSRKLLAMLEYIVFRLDQPDELSSDIKRLARRHVLYGVKEIHYKSVGMALLRSLQKALGTAWSAELENAWYECYITLSSAMIGASREAELA